MAVTYVGRTGIVLEHPGQDLSFRTLANTAEVASKLEDMLNAVASGAVLPGTTAYVEQGGVKATATITLAGAADDVQIVTASGLSVGPVNAGANNTATATALAAALTASALGGMFDITSLGAVVTLTAKKPGTVYNEVQLIAGTSAGTATVSNGGLPAGGTNPVGRYLGRKGGTT